MAGRRGLFFSGLLVLCLGASCGGKQAADYPAPASAPRSPNASEVPVHVLSVRSEYLFDDKGNWSERFTQKYRIVHRDGAETWGGVGATWSPWYMARPVIEATVSDPDGQVLTLDPKTIAEAAAYPEVPDVYGDRRVLRAPLPGVRVGSVITETIARKTTKPFFGGGSEFSVPFQLAIPRDQVELIIDVPEKIPFNYEILDAKVDVQESRANGRRKLIFKGGPYTAIQGLDAYAPSNLPAWPSVAFSTGSSWQDIAKSYDEVIRSKLNKVDVSRIARSATQSARTPLEKANRLLDEVHKRVRYASVAFGQSAIIPATPSQTLERAYGDCKDQSLLLVALLREAGLPATMALLRTGPGEDVRPRLPALDVFDHAIVVVPGETPIWIDPTASYARAGELPEPDQGRLALIIDNEATGLTETPIATAKDNEYLEVREIELREYGPARVREVSTAKGSLEHRLRGTFSLQKDELKKSLTEYVKTLYAAEKLSNLEYGDPEDLSAPYRVELQAGDASIGYTDLLNAVVSTDYGVIKSWLPNVMFEEEPREVDLVLPLRYRAEVRYRIVAPKHFSVRRLPTPPVISFGPARLSRRYQQKDGVVEAQFSFEIDKRQLSSADLQALRAGFEALDRENVDYIEFEHVGQQAIATRQTVKGLEIFRKLSQAEPRSQLALQRWALNLADMGFGEESRAKARAAVALDDGQAVAWRTLGVVLERDTFGRSFAPGFDREGAIAAYQRAAELNPSDVSSKVQAAVLLEHTASGRRYEDPVELHKAVREYDKIPESELAEFESGTYRHNALYALFYAEDFAELRQRLAKLKAEALPHTLALASKMVDEGIMAAVAEADRLGLRGEERSSAFASAAESLFKLRRYTQAAGLMSAAAAESEKSAVYANRAQVMRAMSRVDLNQLRADRPESVVKKALLSLILAENPEDARIDDLLSPRLPKSQARSMWEGITDGANTAEHPRPLLADAIASVFKADVQGSDAIGYRVRVTMDHAATQANTTDFFVVREGKRYMIRSLAGLDELGCEALYLTKQRKDSTARAWLSWAKETMRSPAGDDPLRTPSFLRLWADGKGTPELAAASLCANGSTHKDALEILLNAKAQPSLDQVPVDQAIVTAAMLGKDYSKALEAAERLVQRHPDSKIALFLKLGALWELKRFDALEKAIRKALETHKSPGSERTQLLERLASVQARTGRLKDARATFERLVLERQTSARIYNELAWLGLFTSAKPDEMLNQALQAAQLSSFKSYSEVHTLACVYLELGKVEEARQTFSKLVALQNSNEPSEGTWYVFGALSEAYGLLDTAQSAYKKLSAPKDAHPTSTYWLAKRRLSALERKLVATN